MTTMFQAMALPALGGVYLFGWRALAVLAVACLAAFVTEWAFCRHRGQPVTSAVFVTAGLLALSLPPGVPLGVVAVGAVVAILFGKEVFGGFGRNVFNPAVTGRCFIYVCFAGFLTGPVWSQPAAELPGGFGQWLTNAMTGATPLEAVKSAPGAVQAAPYSLWKDILGVQGGCIGETSALLLLLAAAWLVWRGAADWRSMVGAVAGAAVLSTILWLAKAPGAAHPGLSIFGGGLLFAAVFMVTDPVTSGMSRPTHFITGALVGLATVALRTCGIFPEGAMFAILLVNMFTPLIDVALNAWKTAKRKASQPA